MSSFDDDTFIDIAEYVGRIGTDIDAIASQLPSRRERIATAAMAALLSPADLTNNGTPFDVVAEHAARAADALIAELDKGGVK